jgi:hypothetical protein
MSFGECITVRSAGSGRPPLLGLPELFAVDALFVDVSVAEPPHANPKIAKRHIEVTNEMRFL